MIGENIKKIRESRSMKLKQLSEATGISVGYLSDLENNNKKNPGTDILNKIAFSLGVPIEDFFKGELITELSEDDYLKNLSEQGKILYKKISTLSPKDAEKIIKIINIFEDENGA